MSIYSMAENPRICYHQTAVGSDGLVRRVTEDAEELTELLLDNPEWSRGPELEIGDTYKQPGFFRSAPIEFVHGMLASLGGTMDIGMTSDGRLSDQTHTEPKKMIGILQDSILDGTTWVRGIEDKKLEHLFPDILPLARKTIREHQFRLSLLQKVE